MRGDDPSAGAAETARPDVGFEARLGIIHGCPLSGAWPEDIGGFCHAVLQGSTA